MVFQVNRELCAGCGVCAEVCSAGAIRMVDQRAVIVDALCSQCEACVEACPNGAITAISMPSYHAPVLALPVTESGLILDQQLAVLTETAPPARGLALLAGTALAFVGREVAPRLADVLIDALERRLARPTMTAIAPQFVSARGLTTRGKGERRRTRYRRGQASNRIHKERS